VRNAFARELEQLGAEDPRIVLLSGDIGNRLFDKFKSLFPNRFINCGVAEQNMISVAAGMAMCGLRPLTYTIASFGTTRCLEQIRLDVCYPNLPVIVVGAGAGLCYVANGASHEACEDIAFLRVLPNMVLLCPGDVWEVRAAVREAINHAGPVYIRLGKKNEPPVHRDTPDFKIGRAIVVRPGKEICLLSTGNLLPVAISAAEKISADGIQAQVVSFHTVKPLDEEFLFKAFQNFRLVVTVEEHCMLGGLGGSIAEWSASQGPLHARLLTLGKGDSFLHEAGGQQYARECWGLTPEGIAEKAMSFYSSYLVRRTHG
jgi:transketolase